MMLCVIWYLLYNFINVKNTHGGVILSVKLQTEACNFTKSITPPWVFFTFFKLYKWCQIAQSITYCHCSNSTCISLQRHDLLDQHIYSSVLAKFAATSDGLRITQLPWKTICITWSITQLQKPLQYEDLFSLKSRSSHQRCSIKNVL